MNAPSSNRYEFRKLLSETAQIQTWQAVNTSTQRQCAVKTAADEADIDGINTVLSTSFKCQRRLRSPDIITCREKHLEQRQVFIEYPLLDTSTWQSLSPRLFWSLYPQSLIRISSIADYLHAFGLVHGDLKIENFLRRSGEADSRYALIDLDFLSSENSEPNSLVFGTPDHIAPEIVANDRIVIQSDSFSLGKSLQRYLDALRQDSTLTHICRTSNPDRLANLVGELCNEDFVRRPSYLLGAIQTHDLISQQEFESAQRELLSKILLGHWVVAGRRQYLAASELRKLVITQCKLLGVSEELFELIAAALAKDRRAVFRRVGDALNRAKISWYADYWHIELDDDSLLDLYEYLQSVDSNQGGVADARSEPIESRIAMELELIRGAAESGQHEYSFLRSRELLLQIDAAKETLSDNVVSDLLQDLAELAKRLNRHDEARVYLDRLLGMLPEGSPPYARVLEDAVSVYLSLGRHDNAADLVNLRLSKANLELPNESDLSLYRIKGWLCAFQGDYARGEEILANVVDRADSLGYSRVLMLAYYSLGVMNWRRGRLEAALTELKAGLAVARKHKLVDESLPILSTFTLVYSELGDYKTAAKYGKMAIGMATEQNNATYTSFLLANISFAHIRLADFPKARYWTQRLFDSLYRFTDRKHLVEYYHVEGFLHLNYGNLQQARQSLHRALSAISEDLSAKTTGKLHMNLAEVAVQQGDLVACEEHTKSSREAFTRIQDLASTFEVESLDLVWRLVYDGLANPEDALMLVETLTEHKCWFSAARLLFHLIAAQPNVHSEQLQAVARPMLPIIRSSLVPLFSSLSLLLEAVTIHGLDSQGGLDLFKQAAQKTLRGEARFATLALYRSIGEAYLDCGKLRHAEKYLSQAIRLAETLPNPVLAESSRKLLTQITGLATNQAPLIDSFYGASEILKDISHTDESYRRLLQFALDQTGAERAVLLLRRQSNQDLYVAASLNCDSKSEEEITSISSGVATRTIEEVNPLIVDNALSDRRTKDYTSIVAHNILSVACIPLIYGEQQYGVLYLDHNTLPSLFSSEDIRYLIGIANFLATVIGTVRAYRGINQSNIQLRQDLSRLGACRNFLTSDPTTLDMLERLPEIAYADVPVLIQGESGTGKEIICEMLHKGSRRSDRALVKLNCAAIAETMVESELFGVAGKVATGVASREGKLSSANGGTLLLDEVADMPVETQAKLLRAIEYQQFEKVGSNRSIYTDIRFVCATNRDLIDLLKRGEFRRDLYYRINTVIIEIPPLRDRTGDVELLLDHFLRTFAIGRPSPRFDSDIRQRLANYRWPGNVRELKNFVERCCILYPGQSVKEAVFLNYMASSENATGSDGIQPSAEKALIRRTLLDTNWNQTKAADRLGMPLSTLRRKMRKYGLTK